MENSGDKNTPYLTLGYLVSTVVLRQLPTLLRANAPGKIYTFLSIH